MVKLYIKELFKNNSLVRIIHHYQKNKQHKKNNVKIGFGSYVKQSILDKHVWIGESCHITNTNIGKHTYFGNNVSALNANIGSFCSIASGVTINIGIHPTNFVSTHPSFYSNNKEFKTFADKMYFDEYGSVEIGNDVWIGSKATIMPDIKIGNGAIVAYGAVVTKDIPMYAIVGGIPAKILKYRFDTETIKRINATEWWKMDDKEIENNYKLFINNSAFLEKFSNGPF